MKTIGLIGGMSWESTVEYYRIINRTVKERLGGLHSAKMLLYSVDFAEIEDLMRKESWEEIGEQIARVAENLEHGGAGVLILCTNTVHKIAERIERATTIPFIHIADATGEQIARRGLKKVGLLGTRYTMEEDFYRTRLADKFGLTVLIPPREERSLINDVIFSELCLGVLESSSKARFLNIIEELVEKGAEGIVLGCTEIPLLITQEDIPVPLFDTTLLHALRAVDFALE